MEREEKQRRRKMVQALAAQKRAQAEAAIPLSKADLRDLLETLRESLFELHEDGTVWCCCDHTLKRTRAFLKQRNLPKEDIIPRLREYGGDCDCAVAAYFGDIRADYYTLVSAKMA